MKPVILIILSLVCCRLLSAAEDEETLPGKLTKKDVLQLLRTKQFDELDRLAAQFALKVPSLTAGYSLYNLIGYLRSPSSAKTGGEPWTEHIKLLDSWVAHSPKSVYPRIALGGAYVNWAWSARGGEYADQVTKEGWDLFAQRLGKANTILSDAEKISSGRSELYSEWLTVAYALDLPRERIEEIFGKGRAADRDDLRLYYVKARFLLPRWYGKPGDWETFAARMADERGGSDGDVLYMQISRRQAVTEGDDFFKNSRISYERMKKGFESRLRNASDELGELNSFCYFACIAGDRSTARLLFQRIDSKWRKSQWKNEGRFEKWRRWAEESGASK